MNTKMCVYKYLYKYTYICIYIYNYIFIIFVRNYVYTSFSVMKYYCIISLSSLMKL